jgi:hypothetical protein
VFWQRDGAKQRGIVVVQSMTSKAVALTVNYQGSGPIGVGSA